MSTCGENGDLCAHFRRKRGMISRFSHSDVVTAKTISRLSQGVARLTANDNNESKSGFSNVALDFTYRASLVHIKE